MDYEEELVWPFNRLWGEERQKVRNYLKKKWKDNNDTHSVRDTIPNTRIEKDEILNWWWYRSPYTYLARDISNEDFGLWLLGQYRDQYKLNQPNNRGLGRFLYT